MSYPPANVAHPHQDYRQVGAYADARGRPVITYAVSSPGSPDHTSSLFARLRELSVAAGLEWAGVSAYARAGRRERHITNSPGELLDETWSAEFGTVQHREHERLPWTVHEDGAGGTTVARFASAEDAVVFLAAWARA